MRTSRTINGSVSSGRAFAAVLVSALALCVPAGAIAQTTYTITEIGGANCSVSGIGGSGDAVGQCDAVAAALGSGTITSLGKLPNGTYSVATGINAIGVAVGQSHESRGVA